MRSGIALSSQGGGAGRGEGEVGGIPFKEDQTRPVRVRGEPAGGAARESENDPEKKERAALADLPKKIRTPSGAERIPRPFRDHLSVAYTQGWGTDRWDVS